MLSMLLLRFTLPFAAWLVFFHKSLINMIGVWEHSKTYEHCYLIIPISIWLVWQERQKAKDASVTISWIPVALLILPCILWIIGHTANIAFFEHIATITSLQLIIWAMIGTKAAKAYYFPILYLTFCIPFGEELIPFLQNITAEISVSLVQLSGIPIYREGMYLTLPNGQFEIAEACSGIRFLISSIALGTLFSFIFFKKWWKFFLFIIFSSTFPIIANGIRAYGIIMIGNFSNMKYATGADHLIYGWFFFSLVIIFMFFIAYYFQDEEREAINITTTSQKSAIKIHSQLKVSICIIVIFSIFTAWSKSIYYSTFQINKPIALSPQLKQIPSSKWDISFPDADQTILASSSDHSVQFFSARYYLGEKHGELISSRNHLYNKEEWSLDDTSTLKISNKEASEISLKNAKGDTKRIIYWYCINNYCSSNDLKIKLLKSYKILLKKQAYADIIAISSTVLSSNRLKTIFLRNTRHKNKDN
ncbi:exosortase A [Vibrio salinus]|uniref:exosortase A n=1 Tax=Vibrio salinus TaxID=2899784 RepID=UPI001E63EF89|nr:exosortase A [Vibrio salinus]MCE0493264.1 exosortase A [Vibrio salinus]